MEERYLDGSWSCLKWRITVLVDHCAIIYSLQNDAWKTILSIKKWSLFSCDIRPFSGGGIPLLENESCTVTPLKFNIDTQHDAIFEAGDSPFPRPIIFWALQPLDFGGCTVASYANPFFSTSQTPFVPRLQYLPASDGRRGVFTRELCGSGTAPAPAARPPAATASYTRLWSIGRDIISFIGVPTLPRIQHVNMRMRIIPWDILFVDPTQLGV